MSHPVPTIWHTYEGATSYVFSSGGIARVDAVERLGRLQHHRYLVRAPGVRERAFDQAPHATEYLVEHGYEEWRFEDGPPPCIHCKKHHSGACFDRPKCLVQDCSRDTCVQALVGGYKPACLEHFFEAKVMVPNR